MSLDIPALIATTVIVALVAIWIGPLFGFSFRDRWTERKELRAFKREEKRQKAMIAQCFQEELARNDRDVERQRRQYEREQRRQREERRAA